MLLTTELDKLSGTDWQLFFAQERAKPYFAELDAFVTAAAAEKTVYPAAENIFAAFRACPVSAVRVVILGQDPYHEPAARLRRACATFLRSWRPSLAPAVPHTPT
mgnify:CR=1 FL=1